jgi:hypothetical protein
MDAISTTINNPRAPDEPITINTVINDGETEAMLIARHNGNVLELRALLNS